MTNSIGTLPLLETDEYFMAVCILAAERSNLDIYYKNGACVVDLEGNLLGSGYSSMPRGLNDDDVSSWGMLCHAELNAIANTTKTMENCTIYVTEFPCNKCAQLIIQNGINEVVYLSGYISFSVTKMFDSAGVKYGQFKSSTAIKIEFEEDVTNRKIVTINKKVPAN